ncbi:hypothetical protein GCM10023152_30130 [Agromyces bauzanensis]|uniref:Uncharacterized protein n=1 Tax=Agromyces bauzanensis TaxID=1308924 RepID=A0A917UUS2_9MICO|nr:hypothetical protein GCM10011372_26420 [Agromyces bauzanensis]
MRGKVDRRGRKAGLSDAPAQSASDRMPPTSSGGWISLRAESAVSAVRAIMGEAIATAFLRAYAP